MPQNQITVALRPGFLQRYIRYFLRLIKPTRCSAIRITGACHELAEASALQHHHASAILAVFILACFRHLCFVKLRKVDWIFLGKGTTLSVIFLVRTAGVERTVLAPLRDQRRARPLTL